MKIVIGYDGSASADAAVAEVLRRTWPGGTEVRVVTAVPVPVGAPIAGGIELYGPLWEKTRTVMREQAQRRIREVLARFASRPDLVATSELREEGAVSALLDVVTQWGADLLVLGSQGTTAMGRLFVGSVCHALVAHSPCTVEVVRAPLAA